MTLKFMITVQKLSVPDSEHKLKSFRLVKEVSYYIIKEKTCEMNIKKIELIIYIFQLNFSEYY